MSRRYQLCPDCWREYGRGLAVIPAWLKYLIDASKRERYASDRDGMSMQSLDVLLDRGMLDELTKLHGGRWGGRRRRVMKQEKQEKPEE